MADDNFGFTPIEDEKDDSFGFELTPEEQESLASYVNQSKPGQLESAIGGAEQGFTLGTSDEIGGAIGAGLEKGAELIGAMPKSEKSLADVYQEYRDLNRARYKAQEKEYPKTFLGGQFLGGALLPAGSLGALKNASMLAKAKEAAQVGALMGGITSAGTTEAEFGTPEFLKETATGTLTGAGVGSVLPPVISGAQGVAGELGSGAKWLGQKILGPVSESAKMGYGGIKATSEAGQKAIMGDIGKFASNVAPALQKDIQDLAVLKNDLIKTAEEQGIRLNVADIDNMINSRLGEDAASNLPEVRREIEQFKEILRTAKEGPLVEKTERVFFGDRPTKIEQFRQQAQAKQQLQNLNKVDPQVPQDRNEFEDLFAQKQREQELIPGSMEATPLEKEYVNIDDEQLHGIIKQPQFDDRGNFAGYKKIASKVLNTKAPPGEKPYELMFQPTDDPNQVLGVVRQPILDDSGNLIRYKTIQSKLLPKEEAAKFKDITETVRAGGKDLSRPEEMYQLYKDLKQKSTFGDYSFKSQEASKAAGGTITDVQDILRKGVPGLESTDEKIAGLNRAAEALGIKDTRDINEAQIRDRIISLIGQEGKLGTGAIKAQETINSFIKELSAINKPMADRLSQEFSSFGNKVSTIQEINKPLSLLSLASPLSITRTLGTGAANLGGYYAGKAAGTVKKLSDVGVAQMSKMTPQWLKQTASTLSQNASPAAQEVSNILIKAADADERSRNAIIFGLMQNPAYRQWISPPESEGENR